MTWGRVDDGFDDHPKVIGADLAAIGLWTLCLARARRHHDPVVPASLVRRFAHDQAGRLAQILVDVRLWETSDSGDYVIHNYHEYYKSDPPDIRAVRAESGRRGGVAKAAASKPLAKVKQTASKPLAKVKQTASKPLASGYPEPVSSNPVTSNQELTPLSANADIPPSQGEVGDVFAAWRETLGNRRVSLTPERRRHISARLRDGYTAEELCDAVRGWQRDPWDERIRHNDLGVLLRDGSHVEKFRDYWRHGVPTPAEQKANRWAGKMREFLGEEQGAVVAQIGQGEQA